MKEPKKVWERLKKMQCPICNAGIIFDRDNLVYKCIGCDFRMSREHFEHLVNKLYSKKSPIPLYGEDKNLSELNNL